MIDEEEQSGEDGDGENTPTTQGADFTQIARVLALTAGVGVAAIIFVLLFSQLFLPFVVLFEGSGVDYSFDCREYEGELSTGYNLEEEWLLSENITGYEDIPENQKTNLSNETIEALRSLGEGSFTSSNYSELTEEQKKNFREDLNDERVIVNDRNLSPPSHVFYRGQMYTCDTDRFSSGA